MTEKDQDQFRRFTGENPSGEDEKEGSTRTHQAEGEPSEAPVKKSKTNPDQAEGDRETVEHEIRSMEEKDR